eukprot:3277647-Rhodomonas_salina.1
MTTAALNMRPREGKGAAAKPVLSSRKLTAEKTQQARARRQSKVGWVRVTRARYASSASAAYLFMWMTGQG